MERIGSGGFEDIGSIIGRFVDRLVMIRALASAERIIGEAALAGRFSEYPANEREKAPAGVTPLASFGEEQAADPVRRQDGNARPTSRRPDESRGPTGPDRRAAIGTRRATTAAPGMAATARVEQPGVLVAAMDISAVAEPDERDERGTDYDHGGEIAEDA